MKRSSKPRGYRVGNKYQVNKGVSGRFRKHPSNHREDAIICDDRREAVGFAVGVFRAVIRGRR